MLFLKQSTASQAVLLGPFIDDTDGKTAETGLTIANTDIRLSANGGNMFAKTSGGGTHDEAGWYTITLDATDTATVGRLQISSDVAGALPVFMEFQVVEEDTYTFLYASGASPDTDIAAILEDTAVIGALGAGLTDLGGMSDGMKAEVESEANDALVVQKLDHLVAVADADDVVNNSIMAKLVSSAATADWSGFVNTTDSLQAARDHATTIKSTVDNIENGVGIIVTDTADMQPRVVAIETDTIEIGAAGAGLTEAGGTGDHLTAINLPNQTMDIVGSITGNLSGSVGSVTGAVGSVTAEVTADAVKISGDATAADNLEAQFDTTGLTGDTFPATQAQVGSIGSSAGGALNFEANADNSGGAIDPGTTAFVGVETNNYTDTDREDGTYHVIANATNVIDVVYGFSVGGGRTATELIFKGFANANNDDLTISVWDHPGAEWETLGTLEGGNGTANVTITEALLNKHTGTGDEIGNVYIRFNGSGLSASADLNTDQIIVEAVGIGQTIGYANGAIWVDTNDGVDGTEAFVNGVADNPCKTIANVVSLLSSVGLHRVEVAPGSSLTFGEAHTDELWEGRDWALALGSQNITGIFVFGASISGVGTATGEYEFEECDIGAVTMDNDGHFERCALEGTFTVGQAGTFTDHSCFTEAAAAVTIDFAAVGATTVHLFDFDGEINFKNMAAGDTVHITGAGTITTETCTAGTIEHDGFFEYTDAGGNITEVQSDIKAAVDAIKVPTDKLTFTVANELDANTKSINDAEVVGDGNATPWDGV